MTIEYLGMNLSLYGSGSIHGEMNPYFDLMREPDHKMAAGNFGFMISWLDVQHDEALDDTADHVSRIHGRGLSHDLYRSAEDQEKDRDEVADQSPSGSGCWHQ